MSRLAQTNPYLSPNILSITTIYLTQGLLSLTSLARTFLLKDSLHLDPSTSAALGGIFVLPWTVKPLYGIFTDTFRIGGTRRKGYILLAALGASLSNLGLGFEGFRGVWGEGREVEVVVFLAVLGSGCIAVTDVVADGIVVEESRKGGGGGGGGGGISGPNLQSLCWGSAAVGGILSSYSSGALVQEIGPEGVYRYAAFLPLLVAGVSVFIKEEPVPDVPEKIDNGLAVVGSKLKALKDAFSTNDVWKPTLFLFLWQATPSCDSAFLYFLTDEMHFTTEFLGRVKLVTSVAGLVGVVVYNRFLKDVPIKDMLKWCSVIGAILGSTQLILINHWNTLLGIPDDLFVYGDDVILTVLGQVAFMPTLVLAAKLCPVGVEGTLFALLMSIYNLAGITGSEIGAGLTKALNVSSEDFSNLALLVSICNVSSLFPLLFMDKLMGGIDEKDDNNDTADAEIM
ncbi:hypothetical protein TrST_g908 [Triparma strigata]|uniref:Biopterin transport-related protein BT1 n=1 Tax=Triparma strigata TaxID=1606541 RepID=A0A9W7C6K9_9STRA|nr:hypothetical protein TrST_g908 [Triparma strigata]